MCIQSGYFFSLFFFLQKPSFGTIPTKTCQWRINCKCDESEPVPSVVRNVCDLRGSCQQQIDVFREQVNRFVKQLGWNLEHIRWRSQCLNIFRGKNIRSHRVFWDVVQCRLVEIYRSEEVTHCLRLQEKRVTTALNIETCSPERSVNFYQIIRPHSRAGLKLFWAQMQN
jgi:hypothetical protein